MKKIFILFATALISLSMFATAPVAKQLSHAATKHNAPAVKAETIDLTFDNSSDPSFEYYAADGDWYLGWIDVTGTYIIRFDYLVGQEGKFGTYTIANLDLDYSYFSDFSSGSRVDLMYTDAQFTIVDEGDGAFSLSGYVVCENGNTYNLNGYYAPTPTALENTNAEVKATKLVENGQIVIIRDGVRYNAVGAKL